MQKIHLEGEYFEFTGKSKRADSDLISIEMSSAFSPTRIPDMMLASSETMIESFS